MLDLVDNEWYEKQCEKIFQEELLGLTPSPTPDPVLPIEIDTGLKIDYNPKRAGEYLLFVLNSPVARIVANNNPERPWVIHKLL
jgi:hypothetical protein